MNTDDIGSTVLQPHDWQGGERFVQLRFSEASSRGRVNVNMHLPSTFRIRLWKKACQLQRLFGWHSKDLEKLRALVDTHRSRLHRRSTLLQRYEGKRVELCPNQQELKDAIDQLSFEVQALQWNRSLLKQAIGDFRNWIWSQERAGILELTVRGVLSFNIVPTDDLLIQAERLVRWTVLSSLQMTQTCSACSRRLPSSPEDIVIYIRLPYPTSTLASVQIARHLRRRLCHMRKSQELEHRLSQQMQGLDISYPTRIDGPRPLHCARLQVDDGMKVSGLGGMHIAWPPELCVVQSVHHGSWAANMGIREADMLLWVNDFPTSGRDSATSIEEAFRQRPLLVEVGREPGQAFTYAWKRESAALSVQHHWRIWRKSRKVAMMKTDMSGFRQKNDYGRQQPDPQWRSENKGTMQSVEALKFVRRVDPSIRELGLQHRGIPPERMIIHHIQPGSWADREGLCPGDEIVELDGVDTLEYTQDKILRYLVDKRPLMLTCFRQARPRMNGASTLLDSAIVEAHRATAVRLPVPTTPATRVKLSRRFILAGSDDMDLGLQVAWGRLHEGSMLLSQVEASGWARRHCLVPGDELLSLNGVSVASLTRKHLSDLLLRRRPLAIEVSTRRAWGFCLVAHPPKVQLGFNVHGSPPSRVFVSYVQDYSWAQGSGLVGGDELLAVNGQPVASLDDDGFRELMFRRPLELEFLCWSGQNLQAGTDGEERCVEFSLTAEVGWRHLGFSLSNFPPSKAKLVHLEGEGWAKQSHLQEGDEIIALEGSSIRGLSGEAVVQALACSRPLHITFLRRSSISSELLLSSPPKLPATAVAAARLPWPEVASLFGRTAKVGVENLGFTMRGVPPQKLFLSQVEPGGWADCVGIRIDDEVVAVCGLASFSYKADVLRTALLRMRPLEIMFRRKDENEPSHLPERVFFPRPGTGSRQLSVASKLLRARHRDDIERDVVNHEVF